jgi:hypothetical protein
VTGVTGPSSIAASPWRSSRRLDERSSRLEGVETLSSDLPTLIVIRPPLRERVGRRRRSRNQRARRLHRVILAEARVPVGDVHRALEHEVGRAVASRAALADLELHGVAVAASAAVSMRV